MQLNWRYSRMESNLCSPTFYEHNDQETHSRRKNSFLRIIQDFPTSQTKQKNGIELKNDRNGKKTEIRLNLPK